MTGIAGRATMARLVNVLRAELSRRSAQRLGSSTAWKGVTVYPELKNQWRRGISGLTTSISQGLIEVSSILIWNEGIQHDSLPRARLPLFFKLRALQV